MAARAQDIEADQEDLSTTGAALIALYEGMRQVAATLDSDAMLPEEVGQDLVYARRLKRLFDTQADKPLAVARAALAAVEEGNALRWDHSWFPPRMHTTVFGEMRRAITWRDATRHSAASVEQLCTMGLREAAWYKASDAVYFATQFFNATLTMARLGLGPLEPEPER